MGASQKLIDGHVPSTGLRYPHVCADAMVFYAYLERFIDALNN